MINLKKITLSLLLSTSFLQCMIINNDNDFLSPNEKLVPLFDSFDSFDSNDEVVSQSFNFEDAPLSVLKKSKDKPVFSVNNTITINNNIILPASIPLQKEQPSINRIATVKQSPKSLSCYHAVFNAYAMYLCVNKQLPSVKSWIQLYRKFILTAKSTWKEYYPQKPFLGNKPHKKEKLSKKDMIDLWCVLNKDKPHRHPLNFSVMSKNTLSLKTVNKHLTLNKQSFRELDSPQIIVYQLNDNHWISIYLKGDNLWYSSSLKEDIPRKYLLKVYNFFKNIPDN